MSKKVMIKTKATRAAERSADQWVNGVIGKGGAMKRLTIDVTDDLHSRIKIECTKQKAKMADKLREILEKEFPAI